MALNEGANVQLYLSINDCHSMSKAVVLLLGLIDYIIACGRIMTNDKSLKDSK